MSQSMTNAPPAVSRGRRILLIISLCLNVALIVMIVVSFAIGFLQGARHMPLSARELMMQASGAERANIESVIDAHRARTKQLATASRDAHMHAIEIFEAPTFNKNDMAAAMESMHQADDALRAESTAASIEAMAQLSPAERKAIGDKMQRRARWWGWDRHH